MDKKYLFIWMFIIGFIASSCNEIKNKTNEGKMADSVSTNRSMKVTKEDGKRKVIHYDKFNMDSIIGSYHVSYRSQENREMVTTHPITGGKGKDTVSFYCQDVFLKINKEGKGIILDRKIQRNDFKLFIPENEISNYTLSNFSIKEVRNNEIVFDISFFIPESDIYYSFELTVLDNGNLKINEVLEEESDM